MKIRQYKAGDTKLPHWKQYWRRSWEKLSWTSASSGSGLWPTLRK